MKRVAITDPIEVRVALVKRYTVDMDHELRVATNEYVDRLEAFFKKNKRDTGRAIATFDAVLHAVQVAETAIELPNLTKEVQE